MVLETFWRRCGSTRSRFPPLQAEIKLEVMDIADIENLAANVKTLTAGARSTGPKTESGKFRCAVNAVKHGLAGKNLLLPGEDAQEYENKLDGIFSSMAPKNDAEAEIVALVADDLWKLGRLARIEKGLTLGRVEELLGQTSTGERSEPVARAITAVGTALMYWTREPTPSEAGEELGRRIKAISQAVAVVEATVMEVPAVPGVPAVPAELVPQCDDLIAEIHTDHHQGRFSPETYMKLGEVARSLMGALLDVGHAEAAAQDELRTAVASIALPNKEELAKLAKYRAMLETSLQRRLAALDQIRKIAASSAIGEAAVDKAKEYRVKLRVVA